VQVKPAGAPREMQDVDVTMKRGDASLPAGNFVSSAQTLQHEPAGAGPVSVEFRVLVIFVLVD
jgi:hypothetical protein